MSDVKWIKITTDIFDDEKMLMIESSPIADSIITIWFKLLILAGKQNNDGVFLMNDKIPYTEEMLSAIFRRDIQIVRSALDIFETLEMVEIIEGVITIPNWNKHQTLDSYEKKKERDRIYQQKRRSEQKAIIQKSSDNRLTSDDKSLSVAISEKEIETELEVDNNIPPLSPQGEKKKSNKVDFNALIIERGFEPILEDSIKEWLEYKTQKKDKYTEVGFKKLLTQIENKVKELGTDKVIEVIDESMARNYTGIIFNLATNGFGQGKKDTESEFFSRWSNA